MKYRLPGGPPPPLQEYGAKTSSAPAETATASSVRTRDGSRRSADASHRPIATAPGKKYGTKPKWRPMKKYSTLCAKRFGKSLKTPSASESLVACSGACANAPCPEPSNGNLV